MLRLSRLISSCEFLTYANHARQISNQCTFALRRQFTSSTAASPSQHEAERAAPKRPRRKRAAPVALEVTPEAESRILHLLSQRDPRPVGVRVGLRTRGCNGMAYVLNYADEANAFDEKVAINGAFVFVDPRALMHIVGTKMDFIDNDLVSEFVFNNPNAKGTCGCGESFNV